MTVFRHAQLTPRYPGSGPPRSGPYILLSMRTSCFPPPLLTGFLYLFGSPNRIDGDTKSKRESLNDCLGRIGHADSERELAQLIEKEWGDRCGDGDPPTAGQRSPAEDHNGDRREQERVALKGRRLAGDSGEQKA